METGSDQEAANNENGKKMGGYITLRGIRGRSKFFCAAVVLSARIHIRGRAEGLVAGGNLEDFEQNLTNMNTE